MTATPEDYANDIERIIQEEEREPNELFERSLVMSVLRRAQASEAAIVEWAEAMADDDNLSPGADARLDAAMIGMLALAARIREGRP